ncbi:hypothetical protein H5T87_07790 [bacterium]|nr:hypothetical protein [bacterium]
MVDVYSSVRNFLLYFFLFISLQCLCNQISLSELLKTEGKQVEICQPVTLNEDIVVRNSLRFVGDGCVLQTGRFKLRIEAPVEATLSHIFIGFQPGEVTFASGCVKEVYPQWWGAKGNGKEDDYSSLQSAIDSNCQSVFIPKGRYLITKTLNLTNRPFGLNLIGQGQSEEGSVIVADTGGIAIDASGSRYLHFANFAIESGNENPSLVGILFSRTIDVGFCEFNNLENVRIKLISLPKANNGNGTVGIYNNASELWRARNIYLMADNPIVFTGYNIFKIKSPYTKQEERYVSMSECTIDGASTLHSLSGPAITIENGDTIEILNTYITRSGEAKFPYAIKVMNFWGINLTYTGHIEGFDRFLYTNVTNIVGCKFKATLFTTGAPLIHLEGRKEHPSLRGCEIELIPEPTSRASPLILAEGEVAINSCRIVLYSGQSIECREGEFRGNIVQAWDEEAKINLNPERASYLLVLPKGVEIFNKSAKEKAE